MIHKNEHYYKLETIQFCDALQQAHALRDWIEQIQLDAMQEGMRRAAVVAKENSELPYGQNPTPYSAIITAANNLTLFDL